MRKRNTWQEHASRSIGTAGDFAAICRRWLAAPVHLGGQQVARTWRQAADLRSALAVPSAVRPLAG